MGCEWQDVVWKDIGVLPRRSDSLYKDHITLYCWSGTQRGAERRWMELTRWTWRQMAQGVKVTKAGECLNTAARCALHGYGCIVEDTMLFKRSRPPRIGLEPLPLFRLLSKSNWPRVWQDSVYEMDRYFISSPYILRMGRKYTKRYLGMVE